MLGEAIRWHVVVEVPSRHAEPLLSAFMALWVQPCGPPACLVVDGESSLASDEAGIMLNRQGCARQAFLCDQFHKVDAQLRAEELGVPFKYRLAEATLA
eukprot:6012728-Lingulodinium_polyedra.AAC.1